MATVRLGTDVHLGDFGPIWRKRSAILPGRFAVAAFVGLAAVVFVATTKAADLQMIAPNIPPHFDDQGKGRIGDVIKASLNACGHTVSFTMVPFGRHWKEYRDNEEFDGLETAEADQSFPGYTTDPFMHLQDGATVLAGTDLERIASVEELHGKRIVAFPDADSILGIQSSVPKFKSFKMRADRFDQIRPLFAHRADAVLADGLITANFIRILRENAAAGLEPDIDATLPAAFRKIFAPGPQRLYFRDEAIARNFDRCFQELLRSGEVERITKPYVDRYREVLGNQYPNY